MDTKPQLRKQAAKLFEQEFKDKEKPFTDFSELSFKQILAVEGIDYSNFEKALDDFCKEFGFTSTLASEPHCNDQMIRFYPAKESTASK